MKYLKTYEQKTEPHIGDYVVVRFEGNKSALGELLERNIGKLIKINKYNSPQTGQEKITYLVKFGNQDFYIHKNEILAYSKDKKDLEKYIAANKYNI